MQKLADVIRQSSSCDHFLQCSPKVICLNDAFDVTSVTVTVVYLPDEPGISQVQR